MRTSRTWTISSGERGLLSDTDEVGNRAAFVQEYNRLAKKVWIGSYIFCKNGKTDDLQSMA